MNLLPTFGAPFFTVSFLAIAVFACGGAVAPASSQGDGGDAGPVPSPPDSGAGTFDSSGPGTPDDVVIVGPETPVDGGPRPPPGRGQDAGGCAPEMDSPCAACLLANCGGLQSTAEAACASLIACECACPMNDAACDQVCVGDETPDCMRAINPFVGCVFAWCLGACATYSTVDAGM